MSQLYIGLISGTSVDGIDAALIEVNKTIRLLGTHSHPIPEKIREQIVTLCHPLKNNAIDEQKNNDYIDLLGATDQAVGELFAEAALALIKKSAVSPRYITAIGSHGQTVRHRPAASSNSAGFTLQIGDPNIIAERTGITTVADFRRRDMASGGQGAPFAPAFHQAIAPNNIDRCAFVNLGGIANITVINRGKLVSGYDTGPANGLMDAWILQKQKKTYDENGEWAASGNTNDDLLKDLLADPYFSLAAPKSTGREYFHLDWLMNLSAKHVDTLPPVDVQATLLALTAKTICNEIAKYNPQAMYCCGGGVHNHTLMKALESCLQANGTTVTDTSELGIAPNWVEAAAFAWLAKKHINGEPIDLSAVTGANKACILGMRTA